VSRIFRAEKGSERHLVGPKEGGKSTIVCAGRSVMYVFFVVVGIVLRFLKIPVGPCKSCAITMASYVRFDCEDGRKGSKGMAIVKMHGGNEQGAWFVRDRETSCSRLDCFLSLQNHETLTTSTILHFLSHVGLAECSSPTADC
jgi:hypothetical protein